MPCIMQHLLGLFISYGAKSRPIIQLYLFSWCDNAQFFFLVFSFNISIYACVNEIVTVVC
jgi:hypothetical protein